MEKFIKLDKKDREEALVADTVDILKNSVIKKRMQLEDSVSQAKKQLNKIKSFIYFL